MEKFSQILQQKIRISEFYNSSLEGTEGIIKMPSKPKDSLHSNWLFGIILDARINIVNLSSELLALGIETRPFFFPLNSMPPYLKYKKSESLSNSIRLSGQGLSLPTSVDLNDNELQFITKSVNELVKKEFNKKL